MASEASYAFTFHIGAKSYILFINSLEFDIENNVNFVILKKFFFLKKEILRKFGSWKCDFDNVNFVKRMRIWTCEFWV